MPQKNKTTETEASVVEFIETYTPSEQRKTDSFRLLELMASWSGFPPKMWGPSIIGFGSYHYKYASGHEGDAPILGFSPRKSALTLYVFTPLEENKHLLEGLGKYKISKACIYISKLADIDLKVLEHLCRHTMAYIEKHHECACRA